MDQLLMYFFEASKIITGIFFVEAVVFFLCMVVIQGWVWRYFRGRDY